jgi:peptidyl-prolyl cis-trans isomerase D
MFDLFRSREKSVKILLGVMLLLVAASMLIYLIPGGIGSTGVTGGDSVIAAVGSENITNQDVQRSLARVMQGQANLPKGLLAMYIPRIVEQLVEQKAMAYKAKEMGLTISDTELGDSIEAGFAPQMGGTFDKDQYERFLAQQGMTPATFEKEERDSMLASRLDQMERQALVVSDADARAEYQRKNLKVGLQYVAIEKSAFVSKVSNDPAAVKAFFDKNRHLFQIPEKRSFDLVAGSAADYMQTAQVPEAELQKNYQEEIDSFRTPERVRVRHILIKTQGKPKEEAAALRAKAEQILKQLQAGGDFGEIAKKNSEDPGSAVKGGELGWVTHGQMVPNFEKACFSLKPGELSGIVDTEYGYHIVQVEERQEAHTQTFEEARPQLLLEAKKQVAADMLRKNMDAAHAEVLRNPSQAAAIAAKYGLKYIKQENVANNMPLPEMPNEADLANAIRTAAKGAVTDIYTNDKDAKAGFAVVLNIFPSRTADFNEVQSEVTQKYVTSEADRLAQNAAKEAADSARKGESLEAIAKRYGTTVKTAAPFTIDGAAEGIGSGTQLAAAFKGNVGDIIGPVLTGTGQFVCKVSEKIPADMNQYAANKSAIVQGLEQTKLQVQQPLFRDSVVNDLKRRGKIKLNDAAISHLIEHFEG